MDDVDYQKQDNEGRRRLHLSWWGWWPHCHLILTTSNTSLNLQNLDISHSHPLLFHLLLLYWTHKTSFYCWLVSPPSLTKGHEQTSQSADFWWFPHIHQSLATRHNSQSITGVENHSTVNILNSQFPRLDLIYLTNNVLKTVSLSMFAEKEFHVRLRPCSHQMSHLLQNWWEHPRPSNCCSENGENSSTRLHN